jgi:hypothetical protein
MKEKNFVKIGSLLEDFLISKDLYEPFKGAEICGRFAFILAEKAPFLISYIEAVDVDRRNWNIVVTLKKNESSVVMQGFKEVIKHHKILELVNKDLDGIFLVKDIVIAK